LFGIDKEHQVSVVAHDRIGAEIDGEALAKSEQALFDPIAPVFERAATLLVLSAEKGAPDAA
jgi:hypothetical protein